MYIQFRFWGDPNDDALTATFVRTLTHGSLSKSVQWIGKKKGETHAWLRGHRKQKCSFQNHQTPNNIINYMRLLSVCFILYGLLSVCCVYWTVYFFPPSPCHHVMVSPRLRLEAPPRKGLKPGPSPSAPPTHFSNRGCTGWRTLPAHKQSNTYDLLTRQV